MVSFLVRLPEPFSNEGSVDIDSVVEEELNLQQDSADDTSNEAMALTKSYELYLLSILLPDDP